HGEPVGAADVPGRRPDLDRRRGAAERRHDSGGARPRARRRAAINRRTREMAKTLTRSVDLEPIDRLEEKVKLLVSLVERMKLESARAAEENQRLSHEIDGLRAR